MRWPRICIVSASGQNVFFGEMLEAFGTALREHGAAVEESVDCFPAPADDLVYLFVPHEYHPLVHELARPTATQLRRSVAICTEQPGTSWFETGAEVAARAAAAIDISALGVRELRRRGMQVEHAPLGYVRSWDTWNGDEAHERPIDLTFLGGHNDRRARVLARCAPLLAERRAAIYMQETVHPHVAGSPYFLTGERKMRLLADAKVLLNVHRQELGYLEWLRVIAAMLNGCVVVSEHSLAIDPLQPGEHFVSAEYEHLPGVVDGLLRDPDRLNGIRRAAYELVRDRMPMSVAAEALLRASERAAQAPVPASHRPYPQPVAMPVAPPRRAPEWQLGAERLGEWLLPRLALKHLVLQARALDRRVAELARDGRSGPPGDVVEQLGPDLRNPRVSVLLTVHDYGDLVGRALRSVALSDMRDVEVVAVDDASTDDSVDAIERACAEHPWLSVRLVRRGCNQGLPAARNLAAASARADLLFILDADNMVLPRGLGRLAQALDDDPGTAFAYGLIQTFDAEGPCGVASWRDWDPDRLRNGSYVDAMAMIRREALEEVGGYRTDATLLGWEDFALWVAMADAGLRGVRVPEFVASYRISPHSMLSLTDIDHSAAWAKLLREYPWLATEAPRPAAIA